MAAAPLIEVQGLDALNRAVRDMNKRRPRPLAVRHCEALRDAPSLGFAALTAGNEIDRYEFTADQAVRRLERRTKAAAPEEVYRLGVALDCAIGRLLAVVRVVENADGDVIVLTPKQRQEFQQLADALYGESVKAYNSKRGEYQKLGAEYGLNADRAVGAPASLAQKPRGGDGGGVVDFGSLK